MVLHVSPYRLQNLGSAAIFEIELLVFWSSMPMLPTDMTFSSGLCLQMFDSDFSLGNIIVNFSSGKPQIENKWYASHSLFRPFIVSNMYSEPNAWFICLVYRLG